MNDDRENPADDSDTENQQRNLLLQLIIVQEIKLQLN